MGTSINSGQLTVNGTVTTTVSSLNKAPIATDYTDLAIASKTTGALSTVYTVPAGKVAIVISSMAAGRISGTTATCIVVKGGTTIYLTDNVNTALTSSSWAGQIKLAAGDTIQIAQCGHVCYYELAV